MHSLLNASAKIVKNWLTGTFSVINLRKIVVSSKNLQKVVLNKLAVWTKKI